MADIEGGAQWSALMAAMRGSGRVPDAEQRFFSGAQQSSDLSHHRYRPRLSSAAL